MTWQYDDGGRSDAGRKGKTGDCVTRALAIATGTPYADVYADLIGLAGSMRQTKRVRGSHPRTGVASPVYHRWLVARGWKWHFTMSIGSGCKVHLRADQLPPGRLVARLSRHVVAVIDGIPHDTYDCSREGTRCVYGYYSKD